MRSHRGFVAAICVAALSASACGSSGATRAPSPAASTPTTTAAPSSSPSPSTFYLRWWTTAPLGPEDLFATAPLVISDGALLSVVYPEEGSIYPLFIQPTSQTITDAGLAKIEAEARDDGLLGPVTEFECDHAPGAQPLEGAATSHVVMIVDGETHELTASCDYAQPTPAPGTPVPATWAAFERFESYLGDPESWLGADLGPATTYDPDSLAVLAIPLPDDVDVPDNLVTWPLGDFATFGSVFQGGETRCAMVSGADEATLLAVIKPLPLEAVFVDGDNDVRLLVVRALMPGEPDVCN
jgi:hypothetical protein